MEVGSGLENQLKKQILLTPEVRLSLDILTMPILELIAFLENECLENPFLEMVGEEGVEESEEIEDDMREPLESLESTDSLEWVATPPPSYPGYLEDQIKAVFKGEDQEIALLISRNISPLGFLESTPAEIANSYSLPLNKVEEVRRELMSIDGLGSASINLEEYLLFQLSFLGKDLISKNELEEVFQLLDKDAEKAKIEYNHIFSLFKTIPAYPAYNFGGSALTGEVIDAVVQVLEERGLEVSLTRESRTIILSKEYIPVMQEAKGEALTYLKGKFNRAKEILRALDKRRNTLRRVIYFIVQKQSPFLIGKKSFPEPLTEGEIGGSLNLHQSTVSRAVKNKLIKTPRGLVSLRSLIQTSFVGEDMIKAQLIANITGILKANPELTDLAVSQLLKEKGIKVARRTVAKYRKEAGFPVRRRRHTPS